MNSVIRLGKYLFAIPMILFGVFHFTGADQMAAMAPGGKVMVYVTGLALVAAGVSLIIGKLDKLAAVLLAVMLIIFALAVHLPAMNSAADDMAKGAEMGSILKNIAMAGGALMAASLAKDNSVIG